MGWDKIIVSFIVGVGLLVFLASCLHLAVLPPTDSIILSTKVEGLAAQQGVAVVGENSYENKFSETKGFGGAGGQGGVLSQRESEQALVEMARENNLTIRYAMSSSRAELKKFYWVYNEGKDFYWQDSYAMSPNYRVAEASNSRAQLKKDVFEGVRFSILMWIVSSACAAGVVLIAGSIISWIRR